MLANLAINLLIARLASISILKKLNFLSFREYYFIEINIKPRKCKYDVCHIAY